MEDSDPELRLSLKEMLFDGNAFKWNRLEDLITSAANQAELDLEALIQQVMDFLFSNNGGLLQQQLVEGMITKLDNMGWYTIQKINQNLPKHLQSKRVKACTKLNDIENNFLIELQPIKDLIKIVQTLPGFRVELILKQFPRILREPDTRKMSLEVAQRVAEKGVVRLLKVAAGAY